MPTTLAALLLVAVPALADASSTTPFALLEDGSIVVAVTIGGTGPYRFVLDTGSSRTVISTRLSNDLRLPIVARTVMVTPAGRSDAYLVRLEGLTVDGGPAATVSAAVMAADRYAAGQRVDGLIGQDVLASAIYTIDYSRRAVTWHGTDDTLRGDRLPLSIHNNRLLVRLAQHPGDSRPLDLVPDSGSDALVLFAHAQDKLRLQLGEVGVLSSVSGSRLVRRAELAELIVGSTRWRNPRALVIDSGEPAEMMGDGLLPLHVFARVTFNVADGYLIVHPH